MRDDTIRAFKIVVNNAELLKGYSFKENIKNIRMEWKWHKEKPEELKIEGPNQEQLSAFILTFRKFIQRKDQCSFRYLANHILDDPDVSQEWKNEFKELRENLNKFLDAPPSFIPVKFEKNEVITCREILFTYIFGMHSHEEEHKSAILEEWRGRAKIIRGIFDTQFLQTVVGVFGFIIDLSELCQKELKKKGLQ